MIDISQIFGAIFLGLLAGIMTGITPGLHINLAATIIFSLIPILPFSPSVIAFFLLSMSVSHTFMDNIPTVFLGVPDIDHVASLLPCQKLVLEGRGCEAIKMLASGALLCAILSVILLPLFSFIFPIIYKSIAPVLGIVLICVVLFLVLREEGLEKKAFASIIVVLAGLLGLFTFAVLKKEPLLPLLSGLFGVGSLLFNLNASFPKQFETDELKLSLPELLVATVGGTLAGSIIAVLPGMGPSQAGILASLLFPARPLAFLAMSGGINTANFIVSIATMASMDKARNGSLEIVLQLVSVNSQLMWQFAAASLIVAGLAAFLSVRLAPIIVVFLSRISLKLISSLILLFVIGLVSILSGPIGLLVLFTSASISVLCQFFDVNRSHCMACLLIPVIFYFI